MNKKELVEAVADRADTTQKQANAVLNALLDVIMETLASGDKVTLVGFGTFESRDRKARQGRNPKTGEPIQIAAGVAPVFTAGKNFREAVRNE
ncbi:MULTISPECIES: HU family DNA-binding protein [unclassified Microcoleus]|uniref:HU family DNA-binding protein n=1 Tax=unclassified Microcoleus TaxID=2642155 RepID=UPI0025D7E929|nr:MULTISPECIES: HU family DNA-binding protein [unclassified Microcoleus]